MNLKELKDYKLVYEKDGIIVGSDDAIPSADDKNLISRAALEGKTDPAPVPAGKINITKNGTYDVTVYASAKVNVQGGITPTGEKKITENGKYDITSFASVDVDVPSGPTPAPITKGSVIKLGGEDYRVLSVNEDLTDCEVMHIGPAVLSKYYTDSPTSDQKYTDWDTSDGEKTGIKYAGSLVDEACEDFYDTLPSDIKEAIIEQDLVQHMWQINNVAEGEEDFLIENPGSGFSYRLKKIDNTAKPIGKRHAYLPTMQTIKDYYGNSVIGHTLARTFCLQAWFSDALPVTQPCNAPFLYYYSGNSIGVYNYSANSSYCVCPAFHIDLTKINL